MNKFHGSGIREVDVVHQEKHNNTHADALSRQPWLSPSREDDAIEELQVEVIGTTARK